MEEANINQVRGESKHRESIISSTLSITTWLDAATCNFCNGYIEPALVYNPNLNHNPYCGLSAKVSQRNMQVPSCQVDTDITLGFPTFSCSNIIASKNIFLGPDLNSECLPSLLHVTIFTELNLVISLFSTSHNIRLNFLVF